MRGDDTRRNSQNVSRNRAEEGIRTREANAPPRANLPALNAEPFDRVFLMEGVGAWRPYYSSSNRLTAEGAGGPKFAARPERISYYVGYALDPAGFNRSAGVHITRSVTVHITQYPNAEWARFDVLNSTDGLGRTRLSRFGHTFYQQGLYFYWSSA